jgi:5'-3' exonuclease
MEILIMMYLNNNIKINLFIILMFNLILIDTSYTSFYRYYATIRWYSMAHKEDYHNIKDLSKYEWENNNIFMEKYEKMYIESIKKVLKKKIYDNSLIIFCLDSKNIWRNNIKSDYKKNRVDLKLKSDYTNVFKYTYNNIIPKLINNQNIFSLKFDTIEADDIIGVISLYLKEINNNQIIYIISGDNDLNQLGRNNVFHVNYKDKKIINLSEEQAKIELNKKIILGDKSDNIDNIFGKKRLLKKDKEELLINENKLNKFLLENEKINKKYLLNKQLIDFEYIPNNLKKIIIKDFQNIYNNYKK